MAITELPKGMLKDSIYVAIDYKGKRYHKGLKITKDIGWERTLEAILRSAKRTFEYTI